MKKLLWIVCAAVASVGFADDVVVTGANDVGVTTVSIPANQANTILAVSFKELATGGDICISNLVKTTNLADGDQLMLYTAKNTYSVWQLDANGVWQKMAKKYTINASGVATEGSGDSPVTTTATAGTGIWLVRKSNVSSTATVTLYGAYIDASKSTTTTANAWNLIGNPSQTSFNSFTGVFGDRIVVADGAGTRTYEYKAGDGKGWYYTTYATVDNVVKATKHYGTPTIAPGVGFWYYTQSAKTLTWGN